MGETAPSIDAWLFEARLYAKNYAIDAEIVADGA
jgi:hypothetical protein